MKTFSLLPFLLIMAACHTAENTPPPTKAAPQMAQIEFESKGCYGTCPQFALTIQQDGTASYDAREHNERQGQFTTTLARPQLDSLLQLVSSASYFNQKDSFPAMITDVVEYKSTLTLSDGKTKTIVDQDPRSPAELKRLYTF
jgi:hypothetical protein